MSEQDWVDRFNRDVDSMLDKAGRMDGEPMPTEYRQALDLARLLAAADLSVESRVRVSLRRRLVNRVDGRKEWHQKRKEPIMKTFFQQRRAATILVILLAMLSVPVAVYALPLDKILASVTFVKATIFHEDGTADVVEGGELDQLPPSEGGDSVVIERPVFPTDMPADLSTADLAVESDSGAWTYEFKEHPSLGPIPLGPQCIVLVKWAGIGCCQYDGCPGLDRAPRTPDSVEKARQLVGFPLRSPSYLPEGYALREILITPDDMTFLFYGGPGGDIVLVQTRLRSYEVTGWGVDGPTSEVEVNGQRASWLNNQVLTWKANGVKYDLLAEIGLDEAIRIAASLE